MRNLKVYFSHLFCLLLLCAAITAQGQVSANFTVDHQSGCAPLIVHFFNSSTGGGTYSWNLGNNSTSLQQNVSTSYTTPGSYTVTLTVTNGGSSSTKTMTITVYGAPQVNFSAPSTVCAGTTVNFANQTISGVPGPVTYSWNFGDGGTSTAQNPTHTYSSAGTYNVSLLATNSQGCDSLLIRTSYITVLPQPTVSISANANHFCHPPANAVFSAQSTGTGPYTYAWSFGDNGTSALGNPPHTYQNNGTYNVTLVITDANGCKDTDVQAGFIIVGGPTASFTPPTGCANAPVTFTSNSTPSGTSSYWNFGDGHTGSGSPAYNVYSTGGVYSVQLVADDGTCEDTTTLPVVINPDPVINFTFSPTQICSIPVNISFTSSAPAGSTYSWSFTNGGTSNSPNPTHPFASYAIDSAILVVTNTHGCQSRLAEPIGIYDLYAIATANDTNGCAPLQITFGVHDSTNVPIPGANYPYPITSYVWGFGDGSPNSTQANPTHTYAAGEYTAYVTITTSNGCSATDSIHVSAGNIPPVAITAQPTHICTDRMVYFHATPTNGAYYTWHYGDITAIQTSLDDSTPVHQYLFPGIYHPYVVVSYNGCQDTVTVFNLTITVDSPKAIFTPNYFCDTATKVVFTNNSMGGTSYAWSFGDGMTDTTIAPHHIYPGLGTYSVRLIAYNASSGCYDTSISQISLQVPHPSFTANDTALCPGVPFTCTGTATGGSITGYFWYADGTYMPNNADSLFVDSFFAKGRHTITLVAIDNHNCPDTITKANYILIAKPVDSFYFVPPIGCTPLTVHFIDSSKDVPGAYIVSRSWFYGDNNSTPNGAATVTHTYTTGGTYYPTETIIDNIGCTDTLSSTTPVISSKPTASFTASTLFPCKYVPMYFSNNSINAVSSYWTFGDNGNSSAGTPNHTYTHNGTYTVTLVVTDGNGCKDTMTQNAYLNVSNPTASFTPSDSTSICSPLIENFTNSSVNAVSYNWIFGNNSFSTLTNPSTPYQSPGNYTVLLVATDIHGCKDTATRNLKIYGYAGEFTYSPLTGCSPLTVSFVANITNVPHITWDFSDGNVSATTSSVTATHTYTNPGAYVPKLIISDSTGCSASSLGIDTIKVDAVIAGFTSQPYPVCIYDTVHFVDTSKSYFTPVVTRTWTFNNGTPTHVVSPVHYFGDTSGMAVHLVVINGNGCTDSINGNVTVHPLPVITVTKDTIICIHDSATLIASGGVSYVWSPSTALGCPTCGTTHASPAVAAAYTVKGTDKYGCVNTDSTKVGLKIKTTDWPGQGGEICDKQSIGLKDSGAQSYNWYPPTGLSSTTIADPVASPTNSITYMVVAHEGTCIPDTNYVSVIVHPLPTVKATAGKTTLIAGGNTDLLISGANLTSYYWEPADMVTCDSCSRTLTKITETTTFTAVGTTQYGCQDSDHVTVNILCDKSQVFIPNTFTPNGDGQNDVFYPRGVGLQSISSFRIYNRWGELIFERDNIQLNDESSGWDGTIKGGKPLPDVYVYVVEGVCDNGSAIDWKGDVTLIR